ncbi:MAG: glycerol kinase GlpK [Planctomycetes bacterium]|nr:glycerol kinase GlpK [Planctomycetota bacterium]MCB9910717.1 glycerol kinase GlpK [Planctomycetota bacterium]MCB9912743.1 glycerol kinase GlpK [Planctomycetota bacterium]
MGLLIGLDAGTTGVTAIVYSKDLVPVRRAYREFPQHFPASGWVEHEAHEIRAAVDHVLGEVLAGIDQPVAALGITNQRETVFAVNRRTGKPYGAGIVWQDRRTSQRCQALRSEGVEPLVRARTGLVLDPYFSATKMQWLLENREGVRGAAQSGDLVFCTVDSLVLQMLCSGERWYTEPTNACRTMLFDLDQRAWASKLTDLFEIPHDCLPEVRPSAGMFGMAQLPGGRNVPVMGMAGDQQAALFGQGCLAEGDFKITYGTGCFLVLNTGKVRVQPDGGLLTTLALDAQGQTCYAVEGSIFVGGAVIQWLRDGLGILSSASESESVARSVPDTGGVVLIPAFAGLGAPHWDPDARAALLGMTRGTQRAHIVRAALESIAWQCTDIVELLRDSTGYPVPHVRVDGGAVRNDLLMQMQADFAQAEIWRAQDIESTARGAAALAGLAAGIWSPGPTESAPRDDADRFRPGVPPEALVARREAWLDGLRRVSSHAALPER